jgi:hypothetical protein
MSIDARLNRLMPALSARERATMVLRDFKEKRPQDYRLGQGMTSAEAREYNRTPATWSSYRPSSRSRTRCRCSTCA